MLHFVFDVFIVWVTYLLPKGISQSKSRAIYIYSQYYISIDLYSIASPKFQLLLNNINNLFLHALKPDP